MELSDVVKILNQYGWTSKLINKGYGISVGAFWEYYSLTIKKNYSKNTLMISTTPVWLDWAIIGIPAFLSYQEKQLTFYFYICLLLMVSNIYRAFKERRQLKRLKTFLANQGLRIE